MPSGVAENVASGVTGTQTQNVQVQPSRIRPGAQVEPLSATRYKVPFTMSEEQLKKLERVRALTRHGNIDGDLAIVVETLCDMVIAKQEKRKVVSTKRRRSSAPPREFVGEPTITRGGTGGHDGSIMTRDADVCGNARYFAWNVACERSEDAPPLRLRPLCCDCHQCRCVWEERR